VDGQSSCPASTAKGDTDVICRPSGGNVCAKDAYCTADSKTCPASAPAATSATSTLCRAAAGPCDEEEYCPTDGTTCPSDEKKAAGFVCAAAEAKEPSADSTCDLPDECDGVSDECVDIWHPNTKTCRSSKGPCDLADKCSGTMTKSCPDLKRGPSYKCREKNPNTAESCDEADFCDQVNNECEDKIKAQDTPCRPSQGSCDVVEVCDGSTKSCPADGFIAAGVSCRAKSGVCDIGEVCPGDGPDCPTDRKEPATTVCRAADGFCDVGENCDGSSKNCPTDRVKVDTVVCRGAGGTFPGCDLPELCTGISKSCPIDVLDVGAPCDDSKECTESDTCVGAEGGTDPRCVGTLTCTCTTAADCDDFNPCTQNRCVDVGMEGKRCDFTEPAMAGTVCRNAVPLQDGGGCDQEEVCDGESLECPEDEAAPVNTTCRAAAGSCDVAEVCDGVSKVCPDNVLLPSGTVCRPEADGGCDVEETCFGDSPDCPVDSFRPSNYVCREGISPCDIVEACPGTGPECPSDKTIPDDSPCNDLNDCTFPDLCRLGLCSGAYQCDCAGPNRVDNDLSADELCASTNINQCAVPVCNLATNKCEYDPASPGVLCDDGDDCSLLSTCTGEDLRCVARVACPGSDPVNGTVCNNHGTCCQNECECDAGFGGRSCRQEVDENGDIVCDDCVTFNLAQIAPDGVRLFTLSGPNGFPATVAAGEGELLGSEVGNFTGLGMNARILQGSQGMLVHFDGEEVYLFSIDADVPEGVTAVVKFRTFPSLKANALFEEGAEVTDANREFVANLMMTELSLIGVSPQVTAYAAQLAGEGDGEGAFVSRPTNSHFDGAVTLGNQVVNTYSLMLNDRVTEFYEFEQDVTDGLLIWVEADSTVPEAGIGIRSLTVIPKNPRSLQGSQREPEDSGTDVGLVVGIAVAAAVCVAGIVGCVVLARRGNAPAASRALTSFRKSASNSHRKHDDAPRKRSNSRGAGVGPSNPSIPLRTASSTAVPMTYGSVSSIVPPPAPGTSGGAQKPKSPPGPLATTPAAPSSGVNYGSLGVIRDAAGGGGGGGEDDANTGTSNRRSRRASRNMKGDKGAGGGGITYSALPQAPGVAARPPNTFGTGDFSTAGPASSGRPTPAVPSRPPGQRAVPTPPPRR